MWSARALPRCSCQSSLQQALQKGNTSRASVVRKSAPEAKHWLPIEIFKIDVMFAYACMYAYEFSLKEIILNKPKF